MINWANFVRSISNEQKSGIAYRDDDRVSEEFRKVCDECANVVQRRMEQV